MKKIGLFYGYRGGSTEDVANMIAKEFEAGLVDVYDLSKISLLKLEEYDRYIFGIATVGADHWQDASTKNLWDNFFMLVEKIDIKGKKAAIFGLGNQLLYPDHFCDSIGILYDKLTSQGVKLYGTWPREGYDFNESKALINNKFVGLPLDQDTQDELTPDRIKAWVQQIKKEFNGN